MIGGFIERAVLKAQARVGLGGNMVVWLAAAGLLASIAIVFLTIALYSWLAALYGPAVAALDVGLLYAVLAGVAAALAALSQRNNRQQARLRMARAAAAQASAWPIDPALLAVGVEIGRVIGWRRLLPLAVAGVGILAALSAGRSRHDAPEAAQRQGD